MPTEYTNTLIITGNPKEIQSFAKKCKGDSSNFCLNALHPEPENNNLKDNWSDWRRENWGCKWAHTLEFELSDEHIKISLEAANGYIVPWVIKVSKHFSTLKFNLAWNSCAEIGCCVIQNGEILQRIDEMGRKA